MAQKKRLRVVSVYAWVGAVVCGLVCGSWVVGGVLYWVDLMSGFLWVLALVSGLFGVVLLGLRRWGAGVVCLVGVVVGLYPLVAGRALFERGFSDGDVVVRVGSLNIYPKNEGWRDDMAVLMGFGLDVVVIQEISPEMNRRVSRYGYLDGSEMPYWAKRFWVDGEVSPGLIVSRHPLELIGVEAGDGLGGHQLMCVVDHPGGRFVVGLVHPFSPRNVERWEAGNAAVEAHGRQIERVWKMTGLEVIVGADLNAGYGQVRGRAMRGAGLRASKPVFPVRWGSFPADANPLMRMQLDDLWVTGGIGVGSWEMVDLGGSDHRLVIGEFVIRGGLEDSGLD